jgi:hypothetical protein
MEWRSMAASQANDKQRGNGPMILVLVIGIPLCVEFAAWVVDSTVVIQELNLRELWQEDDG